MVFELLGATASAITLLQAAGKVSARGAERQAKKHFIDGVMEIVRSDTTTQVESEEYLDKRLRALIACLSRVDLQDPQAGDPSWVERRLEERTNARPASPWGDDGDLDRLLRAHVAAFIALQVREDAAYVPRSVAHLVAQAGEFASPSHSDNQGLGRGGQLGPPTVGEHRSLPLSRTRAPEEPYRFGISRMPGPTPSPIERRSIEGDLRAVWFAAPTVPGGEVPVITGEGGVGKTHLAAHLFRQDPAHLRFWFTAPDLEDLVFQMASAFADLRGEELPRGQEQRYAETLVDWLSRRAGVPALLVFDDVQIPASEMAPWIPAVESESVRCLMTATRHGEYQRTGLFREVLVDGFTHDESIDYVTERCRESMPTLLDSASFDQDRKRLADALCGSPVALHQATATLFRQRLSLGDYLRRFEDRNIDLLDVLPESEVSDKRVRAVTVTWELAISAADSDTPQGLARPAAYMMGMLGSETVPVVLWSTPSVRAGLAELADRPGVNAHESRDVAALLAAYSVGQWVDAPAGVRMHSLARRVIRSIAPHSALRTMASAAADGLRQLLDADDGHRRDVELAATHLESILTHGREILVTTDGFDDLIVSVVERLARHRRRRAALNLLRIARGEEMAELPAQGLAAVGLWASTANLYSELGEHERALEIYDRLLGAELDSDTVRREIQKNHASALATAGENQSAIAILERLVATPATDGGEDAEWIVGVRHTLASAYHKIGDVRGSGEWFFQEVVEYAETHAPGSRGHLEALEHVMLDSCSAGPNGNGLNQARELDRLASEQLGESDAFTVKVRLLLQHLELEVGDPVRAERIAEGYVLELRNVHGAGHQMTFQARTRLLRVRVAAMRSADGLVALCDEAELLSREVVEALGPLHSVTVVARVDEVRMIARTGKSSKAIRRLTNYIEELPAAGHDLVFVVAELELELIRLLTAFGRTRAARLRVSRCIALWAQTDVLASDAMLEVWCTHAESCQAQGRHREARTHFLIVLDEIAALREAGAGAEEMMEYELRASIGQERAILETGSRPMDQTGSLYRKVIESDLPLRTKAPLLQEVVSMERELGQTELVAEHSDMLRNLILESLLRDDEIALFVDEARDQAEFLDTGESGKSSIALLEHAVKELAAFGKQGSPGAVPGSQLWKLHLALAVRYERMPDPAKAADHFREVERHDPYGIPMTRIALDRVLNEEAAGLVPDMVAELEELRSQALARGESASEGLIGIEHCLAFHRDVDGDSEAAYEGFSRLLPTTISALGARHPRVPAILQNLVALMMKVGLTGVVLNEAEDRFWRRVEAGDVARNEVLSFYTDVMLMCAQLRHQNQRGAAADVAQIALDSLRAVVLTGDAKIADMCLTLLEIQAEGQAEGVRRKGLVVAAERLATSIEHCRGTDDPRVEAARGLGVC